MCAKLFFRLHFLQTFTLRIWSWSAENISRLLGLRTKFFSFSFQTPLPNVGSKTRRRSAPCPCVQRRPSPLSPAATRACSQWPVWKCCTISGRHRLGRGPTVFFPCKVRDTSVRLYTFVVVHIAHIHYSPVYRKQL